MQWVFQFQVGNLALSAEKPLRELVGSLLKVTKRAYNLMLIWSYSFCTLSAQTEASDRMYDVGGKL